MDENIPLVVPEVNPGQIMHHKGIIANPNCSTIQMVVALKPLHDKYGVKRIVVANRTLERAEALAPRFNARALLLRELPEVLADYDIVVSCTASSSTGSSDAGIGGSSVDLGIGVPSTASTCLSSRL